MALVPMFGGRLTIGERSVPSVAAMVRLMADGEWHDNDDIVTAGYVAGTIQRASVQELLRSMRRRGVVVRRGRKGMRQYRKSLSVSFDVTETKST